MSNVLLVAFGAALLVVESALAARVPLHPWMPNPLLPIAIALGVSAEVGMARGSALCFVLGYLLDVFCGLPMGLMTFVVLATFLVARGAGLRLLVRGPISGMALTFVVCLLASSAVLALRAIFERPAPFPLDDARPALLSVLAPAISTALLAPALFALVRRIEAVGVTRGGARRAER
ncbi:MAG: hypothetical protein NZ898_02280 [Myxococcota bacterium]|nr:hypothetical protein [Myxococcota bacterium]MDW8361097.1 hypothetical protein [Myxococcales bacterium]